MALRRARASIPRGKRCLVIGAGGAARAVVLALAEAGAAEVVVVNRTRARAERAAALAGDGRTGGVGRRHRPGRPRRPGHARGHGAWGWTCGRGACPSTPSALHAGQVVADLVYHPRGDALAGTAAQARGALAVGGLGMLVHQAALALERWTGRAAPVEAMWAAAEAFPPL